MEEKLWILDEIKKYISEYGEVPPHWVFRPDSHPYSIGWRMGSGESFTEVFYSWFEKICGLKKKELIIFLKYSPPPRWLAMVIDNIWDLEGWNNPDFDYGPYLKKLKDLGFDGTDKYEDDLADERWLE